MGLLGFWGELEFPSVGVEIAEREKTCSGGGPFCGLFLNTKVSADNTFFTNRAMSTNQTLSNTNKIATNCRISAVAFGYFSDEYIQYFTPQSHMKTTTIQRPTRISKNHPSSTRHSPVINRGTYTRTTSIDKQLNAFLTDASTKDIPKQIISLGAGSDTRFFNLSSQSMLTNVRYYELDLPINTISKSNTIVSNPSLSSLLDPNYQLLVQNHEIHSHNYNLLSQDLNQFTTTGLDRLKQLNLDYSIPTFVICECILIYLQKNISDDIITTCANLFKNITFATFEHIQPFDPFGKMMINNLEDQGISLLSIHDYPSVESQKKRYLDAGFTNVDAMDLNQYWDEKLDNEEKKRVEKCQFLDEIEEWRLFGSHYCLVVAKK